MRLSRRSRRRFWGSPSFSLCFGPASNPNTDEADDILKQMEECGSFSLGHSPSDSSSEEQQGRERVEDEDKGFELLVKLKRIQLLLRENENLEAELEDLLQSSEVKTDKTKIDCINATPALLDEAYENISEIVCLYRSMTSEHPAIFREAAEVLFTRHDELE